MTSLVALTGFAQFTIGATYLTFDGHAVPAGSSQGQFYNFQPNNGGTFYTENTCTTAGTQGDGSSFDLGGFDPDVYDATLANAPNTASDGIIFYGGGIRRVYFGSPCTAQDPSFGFHTGTASGGIAAGSDIDLSSTANQKIKFTYQSDVSYNLELQLFHSPDGTNYTSKLSGATFSLIGDNAPHTLTIDFSPYIQPGADMSNIREVAFTYPSETKSSAFAISIADIELGSSVTGLFKNHSSLIGSSAIYPNPATNYVTFHIEMERTQQVKITLNDLLEKKWQL